MPTIGGIVVATGAPADNRRTLLDVVDELARPVDAADTTIRALAADGFRAAVRIMNRKGLWPWEIMEEEVNITANQKFSTISNTVKKPLAMHFLNESGGARERTMRYQSYDRFLEKYTLDYQSEPHTYTIPNLLETRQIQWHPIPDANYIMKFTFYRVTPAPRTEQEVVEIPDHHLEAYMSLAWYEFMKRIPSEQRPFPITIAMADKRQAFRELSAHVNSPGDRSRQIHYGVR